MYRKNRKKAAPKINKRLVTLILLGCIALCICFFAGLTLLERGPEGPAVPEFGTSAGPWMKNEQGWYFAEDEETVVPAAVGKGIDVSKYQGMVDWSKAKSAGVEYALLRCGFGGEWDGEGNYAQDDIQWRANADACTRLGIPFGAYIYSYATTVEEARSEADHVARLLGLVPPPFEGLEDYTAAPYQLSLPVYYDLEDKAITGLFEEEMAEISAAFFDRLHQLGYQGEEGLYASYNWVYARFGGSEFDRWRDHLWIARFGKTDLGYTGEYEIWQSSYTAPGVSYGVESETVDIDLVMQPLTITGVETEEKNLVFTNTRKGYELWVPNVKEKFHLLTNEPSVEEGGQKVFWASSDENVIKLGRKGVMQSKGEGICTLTATLADGTKTAECIVRVGAVTVDVYATGNLRGSYDNGTVSLADLSALRHLAQNNYFSEVDSATDCTNAPEGILIDTGNSLQGVLATSVTGGMDMTSAFAAADYDLQMFDTTDLAFGVARLKTVATATDGPSLAANLRSAEGMPLFYRTTSWNRNRIGNGMNYIVERAGHKIGFFALTGLGRAATPNEAQPYVTDALETAAEQVAALRSKGAEVILCITGTDCDYKALAGGLKNIGVDAIFAGAATESEESAGLPVLGTGKGLDGAAHLAITFRPDNTVELARFDITAEEMLANRSRFDIETPIGETFMNTQEALAKLTLGDAAVLAENLFTLDEPQPSNSKKTQISFGNWVAGQLEEIARKDKENWPQGIDDLPLVALAGVGIQFQPGVVTRGMLANALPTGERLQLVQTSGVAVKAVIEDGAVSQTYLDSLRDFAGTEDAVLLMADTRTIGALSNAVVLRDYGDFYWNIRRCIGDATGNFAEPLVLPEAPVTGVGRNG